LLLRSTSKLLMLLMDETFFSAVPNILLFYPSSSRTSRWQLLADDQGWGDVGYNKYSYQSPAYKYNWTSNPPRTPNLDAMANGSFVVFVILRSFSCSFSRAHTDVFSYLRPLDRYVNEGQTVQHDADSQL
jgi:hypothetical protein